MAARSANATLTCGYNKNSSHRSAKDLENGTANGYTYGVDTTGSWERSGETAAGSPAGSIRWRKRVNCPPVGSRTQEAPTDATGALVESYTYDAFGSALPASPHKNRFLFTGREWFAGIATYDYRNRIYNATLGGFLQTDPIRFDSGDMILYWPVSNIPVNAVEPTGLLKLPPWLSRAACLAAALKNHRASLDGAEKAPRTRLDACLSYACPYDCEACIRNCLGIHDLQVAKAEVEYAAVSVGRMAFTIQKPWGDPYPSRGGPLPPPPPNEG